MTGQEILQAAVEQDFDVTVIRKSGRGDLSTAMARKAGTVNDAVVEQWTADAATISTEQRRQLAYRFRKGLMAGKSADPSVSLATTAALIDMLEA